MLCWSIHLGRHLTQMRAVFFPELGTLPAFTGERALSRFGSVSHMQHTRAGLADCASWDNGDEEGRHQRLDALQRVLEGPLCLTKPCCAVKALKRGQRRIWICGSQLPDKPR